MKPKNNETQFGITINCGKNHSVSINKNPYKFSALSVCGKTFRSNYRFFTILPAKTKHPLKTKQFQLFALILVSLSFTFFSGTTFSSCQNKVPAPASRLPSGFTPNYTIPDSFIRTCTNCGFDNLNTWQQFNRILWNLDYIGWESNSSFSETNFQAVWDSSVSEGQILCKTNKQKAPYLIESRLEADEKLSEGSARLFYNFTNLSPQIVTSFTVVFFVFDEEGNPLENSRSSFQVQIPQTVAEGQTIEDFINLSKYIYINDDSFYTDFIYVSRIEYKNGSVWTDPFGRKYYN